MFNASFKSSEIKSDSSDDENNDNQTSRPTNTPGEIDGSTMFKRKMTIHQKKSQMVSKEKRRKLDILSSNFNFQAFEHDRNTQAIVLDEYGRLKRWHLKLDWQVPKKDKKLCSNDNEDLEISAFDDFRCNKDIDEF